MGCAGSRSVPLHGAQCAASSRSPCTPQPRGPWRPSDSRAREIWEKAVKGAEEAGGTLRQGRPNVPVAQREGSGGNNGPQACSLFSALAEQQNGGAVDDSALQSYTQQLEAAKRGGSEARGSSAGERSIRSSGDDLTCAAAPRMALLEQGSVGFLGDASAARGSAWHRFGGSELEPLLRDITLVSVRWLLRLARQEELPQRKGVLPPWHELPLNAEARLDEMRAADLDRGLPIVCVSCPWLTLRHPDPDGRQLRSLVPLLELIVAECDRVGPYCTWGVLWDVCALPQRGFTTARQLESNSDPLFF